MYQICNCLTHLAIPNHRDCHFKFQNWSRNTIDLRSRIEDPFVASDDHIGAPNCVHCWTWNGVLCWALRAISVWRAAFWCPFLTTSLCHVPCECRCPIEKSDYMRLTSFWVHEITDSILHTWTWTERKKLCPSVGSGGELHMDWRAFVCRLVTDNSLIPLLTENSEACGVLCPPCCANPATFEVTVARLLSSAELSTGTWFCLPQRLNQTWLRSWVL